MDREKKKNNWFTQATLRAAMADRPEIMQSSGWFYDENGNLFQGNPFAEGPAELRESLKQISSLAGLDAMGAELAMPYLIKGASKIIRNIDTANNLVKSRKIMKKLDKLSETLGTDNVYYHNPGSNDIQELSYFTGDTDRVIQTKRAGRNGKIVYADRTHFKNRYPSAQAAEDALDEAIEYSSYNRTNRTTKDIVKQIAEDSASLNSGDKVSLITDEALSKDSYPLMQSIFLRNQAKGVGQIAPVIDDGNVYRMIRLNEYGHNPKSLKRIDDGIESMRTLLKDDNIPGRVSVGPFHYVPAFEFTKFDVGGFIRKYSPERIKAVLAKLNQ